MQCIYKSEWKFCFTAIMAMVKYVSHGHLWGSERCNTIEGGLICYIYTYIMYVYILKMKNPRAMYVSYCSCSTNGCRCTVLVTSPISHLWVTSFACAYFIRLSRWASNEDDTHDRGQVGKKKGRKRKKYIRLHNNHIIFFFFFFFIFFIFHLYSVTCPLT